jgi:hypothetical protein
MLFHEEDGVVLFADPLDGLEDDVDQHWRQTPARAGRAIARLELEYPQQLNRWLPLVKWLLAFPQYLIVGALVGSGYVVATSMQDGRAVSYSTPSLIGACVLIAAIALLFTTRYPPGLFDLALGIDRWGYRLLVCVALMTDRYPPFRLDQGSIDIEGPPQSPATSEAWQVEQPGYGPEAERG